MSSSLNAILEKIYNTYGGDLTESAVINISWQSFVGLLSAGEKPVYGSIRTIREKWQQLHYSGYLKAVNSYASRVNAPALLDAIGVKSHDN